MSKETMLLEGLLHSRTLAFKRKQEWSHNGIEACLAIGRPACVSLSFGKQSICLADMVLRRDPTIPCFFLASSETWMMANYTEVIHAFLDRLPSPLTIQQTNHADLDVDRHIEPLRQRGVSLIKIPPPPDRLSWKACRDRGDADLQALIPREHFQSWFWGFSRFESKHRRQTVYATWEHQPHRSLFRYTTGHFRSCPLMEWEDLDVLGYIALHDLPLLDIYWLNGIHSRTTARLTKKAIQEGALTHIYRTNIEGFHLLLHRFPELSRYL
jgi:3'-phosphoadenosine 5'-phosphosulfate sulfotransferase (PAPS reductase)/FAD synthetase